MSKNMVGPGLLRISTTAGLTATAIASQQHHQHQYHRHSTSSAAAACCSSSCSGNHQRSIHRYYRQSLLKSLNENATCSAAALVAAAAAPPALINAVFTTSSIVGNIVDSFGRRRNSGGAVGNTAPPSPSTQNRQRPSLSTAFPSAANESAAAAAAASNKKQKKDILFEKFCSPYSSFCSSSSIAYYSNHLSTAATTRKEYVVALVEYKPMLPMPLVGPAAGVVPKPATSCSAGSRVVVTELRMNGGTAKRRNCSNNNNYMESAHQQQQISPLLLERRRKIATLNMKRKAAAAAAAATQSYFYENDKSSSNSHHQHQSKQPTMTTTNAEVMMNNDTDPTTVITDKDRDGLAAGNNIDYCKSEGGAGGGGDMEAKRDGSVQPGGEWPEGKPSWHQLQHIVTRLSMTLPEFFVGQPDLTIYREDVQLWDKIHNIAVKGRKALWWVYSYLSISTTMRCTYTNMKVLSINPILEDGTVRVRWRVEYISLAKGALSSWRYYTGKGVEDMVKWYDGYSVMFVDSDGMVYRHIIDNVMQDEQKMKAETKAEKVLKRLRVSQSPSPS